GLRHPVVRALGHPAAGVAAYALVLGVVHLPAVYDAALRRPLVHDVEHAALFWSAAWLWAPLLRADPLPHAPGAIGRAAALLGAMTAMSVVGVVLATGAGVAYPHYAAVTDPARALHDQGVAGGIMWIGGMVVGLPLLLGIAWRTLAEEERRATVRAARADGGGPRA
ncbi:cytochrome c oxidase assembly protein, partial [Patulibacter sp. S7RM1-6]